MGHAQVTMSTLPAVDPASRGNSSFSKSLPGMQLAVDSTSLGEFKVCPRKYYYSILRGLGPRGGSVHLIFGIWMHESREKYDRLRLVDKLDHDEALERVLDWALRATWNVELNRPWVSGHNLKTRQTLIQTIVWYLDAFGRDDPFETLVLADGRAAVELSFSFDSDLRTNSGEIILFCGHLDRIATLNGVPYIKDIKTASREPDSFWARQFTPGNQFSMYSLAGRVAFGLEVKSLIVDGIQIGVGFSRFGSHLVPRDDATLAEWKEDAGFQVAKMEDCAGAQYWPMNDTACGHYGGCPFQGICARSPASREQWIATEYEKREWDPLRVRGDV